MDSIKNSLFKRRWIYKKMKVLKIRYNSYFFVIKYANETFSFRYKVPLKFNLRTKRVK